LILKQENRHYNIYKQDNMHFTNFTQMKTHITLFAFTLLTLNALGQINTVWTKSNQNQNKKENPAYDTIPKVTFKKTYESDPTPALYINGKYSNKIVFKTINPDIIDSINVKRGRIVIEGKKHNGQINIRLKKGYQPNLISLTDLKLKYTKLADQPSIFMINDEILYGDYDTCIVDEKYILNITVENFVNKGENLNFNIIKLVTRTEENIKKSKEIMIRGINELISEK